MDIDYSKHRKDIHDWYSADRNKNFIFYIVVGLWTLLFTVILTVLPLYATSSDRASFYAPLIVFIPLIYVMTLWLLKSSYQAFTVNALKTDYSIHDLNVNVGITQEEEEDHNNTVDNVKKQYK